MPLLRNCDGRHRLLAPIRPIALTLCDVVSLARNNRVLALAIGGIVVLLLFTAHLAAKQLEQSTFDMLYALIKSYMSKKATGIVQQGALHWLLGNGTFFLFRFVAFFAVWAAYDLGRNTVFALGLLVTCVLLGTVLLGFARNQDTAWLGYFTGWLLAAGGILGWFWSRYMSTANLDYRSFDFDVGAALVRLRRF